MVTLIRIHLWYLANATVLHCREMKNSGRNKAQLWLRRRLDYSKSKKKYLHLDGRKALWTNYNFRICLSFSILLVICRRGEEKKALYPPDVSSFLLRTPLFHWEICEVTAQQIRGKVIMQEEASSFPGSWRTVLLSTRKHLVRNVLQIPVCSPVMSMYKNNTLNTYLPVCCSGDG